MERNYTTQMDAARKGIVTEQIKAVAQNAIDCGYHTIMV